MGVTPEPSPVSGGGRVTRPVRSGRGGGGGPGGDLGVGKARPGPRSHRALPEHPAEVAVPRVVPRRVRGRWPVCLAVFGGEGRLGSSLRWLLVTSACVVVWPPRPRWRGRVRTAISGEGGHKGGSTKSADKGLRQLACCVWFRYCSLVSLCPVCGRPRGTAGGGLEVWAGRVGSGGRPRRGRGPWRSRGGPGGPAGGRRCP